MTDLVRQLYELGVVGASFIGLDSTPVMANTKQNNPKSFVKTSFPKNITRKVIRIVLWEFIPLSTSTTSDAMSSTGVTRAMYW